MLRNRLPIDAVKSCHVSIDGLKSSLLQIEVGEGLTVLLRPDARCLLLSLDRISYTEMQTDFVE